MVWLVWLVGRWAGGLALLALLGTICIEVLDRRNRSWGIIEMELMLIDMYVGRLSPRKSCPANLQPIDQPAVQRSSNLTLRPTVIRLYLVRTCLAVLPIITISIYGGDCGSPLTIIDIHKSKGQTHPSVMYVHTYEISIQVSRFYDILQQQRAARNAQSSSSSTTTIKAYHNSIRPIPDSRKKKKNKPSNPSNPANRPINQSTTNQPTNPSTNQPAMTFNFTLPRRDRTKKLRTKIRNFHEEAVRRSFNKLNPFRERIKMVFSSSNRHKQHLAQLEQFQQLEYHNPHLIAYQPIYHQLNPDGSYGAGAYRIYEKGDDTVSDCDSGSEESESEDEREIVMRRTMQRGGIQSDMMHRETTHRETMHRETIHIQTQQTLNHQTSHHSLHSLHTSPTLRPGSQELPPPYATPTIEPNRLTAPIRSITKFSEKRKSLYESIYNSSCESFFSVASSFRSFHDSDDDSDEEEDYFSCDEEEGEREKVRPCFEVEDPMVDAMEVEVEDVAINTETAVDMDVDMDMNAPQPETPTTTPIPAWKPLGHMKSRSSGHFKPAGRFSFRFESLDDPVDSSETEETEKETGKKKKKDRLSLR
ncbi:hypothetical protein BZA77DRAFT_377371 [Pyronema omphalodes]|nr:hypothetical protein BZA77DRAFT_377371 [Pyronema omphalodes]